ncbi:Hypothetical protein SRAE_X000045700 [Strongyloides ratti]|uniref:Uncharacterized protein n=1 Tax=Strongyloides ratti TaxID=34506 RepID=A0A090LMR6_STRRB|nr:Hypothetical protein SRAE_X000045700 [Strongyloides ratti]CEF71130.1 Hypothetical protein SRAE_X000045700 [Strongyloides ratti]
MSFLWKQLFQILIHFFIFNISTEGFIPIYFEYGSLLNEHINNSVAENGENLTKSFESKENDMQLSKKSCDLSDIICVYFSNEYFKEHTTFLQVSFLFASF